jgi:hypothetical protein
MKLVELMRWNTNSNTDILVYYSKVPKTDRKASNEFQRKLLKCLNFFCPSKSVRCLPELQKFSQSRWDYVIS